MLSYICKGFFNKVMDGAVIRPMQIVAKLLICGAYRVQSINLKNIPKNGAAVLVCNHVSFVDAVLIYGQINRPVRFVMDHQIFQAPALNWLFRLMKAIPIASEKLHPSVYHAAMNQVSAALKNDELVCIFPEGKITRDGFVSQFRRGIENIVSRDPVPVIPMALSGLWGSLFSYEGRGVFRGFPENSGSG